MSVEPTQVTDPVCGMTIDRAGAIVVEHRGRPYHFCSRACADTFRDEPGRWLADGGLDPREHDHS